jgi:hypothetical protein
MDLSSHHLKLINLHCFFRLNEFSCPLGIKNYIIDFNIEVSLTQISNLRFFVNYKDQNIRLREIEGC